ncbi:MAG: DNA gyrase/topoisomerase IV subunit A, partial [Prevotellaceae bacterium]|nr:DNA gyrase/topoisomerase IV subunit A [Prevotellaceae bacterium]
LYPEFPTGRSIDVSRYNDGQRGGSVRVRARIEKRDTKTLAITEIPYGKTTGTASKPSTFVDSILKAAEKGKIKVRKVEDLTAAKAEILIHLTPGASSDKTIDALYACTDCEVSISPNCCVIDDRQPCFLAISDVLRRNVDTTLELLRKERLIRKGELLESLHFATLEQIFIEERIYKDKEFENAKSNEEACQWMDKRLTPWYPKMVREVTRDDLMRLLEIKMQRILRFNKDKAEELIAHIKSEIKQIDRELANMVEVTADWFRSLKEKYGAQHPRLTEIKNFDNISAATVVEANQKLYINRDEGFLGTGLKKDEYVCNCSDMDDVILFYKDGTYKVTHIAEKLFVGETERSKAEKKRAEIIHLAIFKKTDTRTVYNVVYTDGKNGRSFMKRFSVTSVVRDREYDITQGKAGSKVIYFTANPNGEAEVIKVTLKPNPKLKRILFDKDFSEIAIKGRQAMGNLLSKAPIARIGLKSHGGSTLGGRKVWFDRDVRRLNYDSLGDYLGEFNSDDRILVILQGGEFYLSTFEANNHYEDNILRIEKFQPSKVWTLCLQDADQGYAYLKRFSLGEAALSRHQQCLGENPENRLLLLTDTTYPLLQVNLGGDDAPRGPLTIEAESFVGVKGFKAKGKRLTTLSVESIEELPPLREDESPSEDEFPAEDPSADEMPGETEDPDGEKTEEQVKDELTGQLRLFD